MKNSHNQVVFEEFHNTSQRSMLTPLTIILTALLYGLSLMYIFPRIVGVQFDGGLILSAVLTLLLLLVGYTINFVTHAFNHFICLLIADEQQRGKQFARNRILIFVGSYLLEPLLVLYLISTFLPDLISIEPAALLMTGLTLTIASVLVLVLVLVLLLVFSLCMSILTALIKAVVEAIAEA